MGRVAPRRDLLARKGKETLLKKAVAHEMSGRAAEISLEALTMGISLGVRDEATVLRRCQSVLVARGGQRL